VVALHVFWPTVTVVGNVGEIYGSAERTDCSGPYVRWRSRDGGERWRYLGVMK
jgi:hypothetical protein